MKSIRFSCLALYALLAVVMVRNAVALESDQLSRDGLASMKVTQHRKSPPHFNKNGQAHARQGVPINSLPNWNDHYFADGFDPNGNPNRHWYTNTVGDPPEHRGTTLINVPIVPVIMDLRNEDGSPRFVNGKPLVSSSEAFVEPILNSAIFAYSNWSSSSVPTQFIDAVQRASYFSRAKDDWHTLLVPSVKPARRMVLNKGSYLFALNEDGTCCYVILVDGLTFDNALIPSTPTDTTTLIGAAENAGDITTKDISVFLFPNTVVLEIGGGYFTGFHGWDFEPANSSKGQDKYYVFTVASWITPGVFLPPADEIQDISTLAHELAEIMNDPFIVSGTIFDVNNVSNITPWWLAPNGFCNDYLEVDDGAEFLPNNTYPITMNGMTYHLPNSILVPWFKREYPSSALHHAYSYPNESLITSLLPSQTAYCQ